MKLAIYDLIFSCLIEVGVPGGLVYVSVREISVYFDMLLDN